VSGGSAVAVDGPRSDPFRAAEYDRAFAATPLGLRLRQAVHRRLDARFAPGSRVLEIGCGTGEDAVHLGRRGVSVLATDASPEMVEQARRKVLEAGLESSVAVRRLAFEELGTADLSGPFDGAVSNFGAINCAADLPALAETLGALLAPGAPLVLCVMGPWVPWEWAYFLARGEPRKAFRRFHRAGTPWRGITVRYPSIGWLTRTFAPAFRRERTAAVGVLLPPSYLEPWARRHPRLLHALDRCERRFESLPPLSWLADHYLAELVRR
jgi:SAM-dependent methyltransferase